MLTPHFELQHGNKQHQTQPNNTQNVHLFHVTDSADSSNTALENTTNNEGVRGTESLKDLNEVL